MLRFTGFFSERASSKILRTPDASIERIRSAIQRSWWLKAVSPMPKRERTGPRRVSGAALSVIHDPVVNSPLPATAWAADDQPREHRAGVVHPRNLGAAVGGQRQPALDVPV